MKKRSSSNTTGWANLAWPRTAPTFVALLSIAAIVVGCGETKPSKFYSLSSMVQNQPGATPTSQTSEASIGVGPVELPKYLDRPTIVSFATPNRVDISEYERWAEPLSDNFTRTLAENLSALLGASRVDTYPFMPGAPRLFDRQVLVDVSQFRQVPDNKVELRAAWRVVEPERRRNLANGSFATLEPIEGQSVDAVVAAMSRAVAVLSREIAGRMRELPAGR
jgi:uncharacterized lipoprotein YmbA